MWLILQLNVLFCLLYLTCKKYNVLNVNNITNSNQWIYRGYYEWSRLFHFLVACVWQTHTESHSKNRNWTQQVCLGTVIGQKTTATNTHKDPFAKAVIMFYEFTFITWGKLNIFYECSMLSGVTRILLLCGVVEHAGLVLQALWFHKLCVICVISAKCVQKWKGRKMNVLYLSICYKSCLPGPEWCECWARFHEKRLLL